MICTANGTAVAGQYRNGGFAIGETANIELVIDADPSHYLGASGTINLEKSTNGVDADTPNFAPFIPVGDQVTWSYVVTNEANTTMSAIAVVDDQLGPVTCPTDTLAPSESMTCLVTGVAQSGIYRNDSFVQGTDAVGGPHQDSDPSHYFGYTPGITVEKSTNGVDADTAPGPRIGMGDTVVWRYEVTTGGAPIENVVLTDDQAVTPLYVSGDDGDQLLEAGETWIYQASGSAVGGQYTNLATVVGHDTLNEVDVTDTDPSNYNGVLPITGPNPFWLPVAAGMLSAGLALLLVTHRRRRT
jgi:LPXTG-motif cell wall-anchored protein